MVRSYESHQSCFVFVSLLSFVDGNITRFLLSLESRLEHLNLVVGDMDLAKKFYVEFLGLSRDDNPKHFNLGQQQVRLSSVGASFWHCTRCSKSK